MCYTIGVFLQFEFNITSAAPAEETDDNQA
nr:MAG TPA: hypothetical protein [Caudoviricetes sp.]